MLAGAASEGERIRLEGPVFDGAGAPVRDALIEIWQANAHGRYEHPADRQDKPLDPAFRGFGRAVHRPRDRALRGSRRSSPGACPGATARRWRRTSTSGSSRAASTSA